MTNISSNFDKFKDKFIRFFSCGKLEEQPPADMRIDALLPRALSASDRDSRSPSPTDGGIIHFSASERHLLLTDKLPCRADVGAPQPYLPLFPTAPKAYLAPTSPSEAARLIAAARGL